MVVPPSSPAAGLSVCNADAQEKLLACVRCGFCLSACPTYTRLSNEADSPRGRLLLMRAVAEGRLAQESAAFADHLGRCVGCRACEAVCPGGVEFGAVLDWARGVPAVVQRRRLLVRFFLAVFSSPAATRWLGWGMRALRGTRLCGVLARLLPRRFQRLRIVLAMLAASRPWPRLRNLPSANGPPPQTTALRHAAGRAAILVGCVQAELFERVNLATARVLAAHGWELVAAPGQGCCGALHAHAGDLDGARELARRNIDAFERAGVEVTVVNAAGCGAALKEYGAWLRDDPHYSDRARRFSAKVKDVTELVAENVRTRNTGLTLSVAYDAPCHLVHAQRLGRAPVDALAAISGLEHRPLLRYEECCGGAGLYFLLEPELSGQLLADKVRAIRETGAEAVVTANPGCMLYIGAGLVLEGAATAVLHPVELLDESYRREREGTTETSPAPLASGR